MRRLHPATGWTDWRTVPPVPPVAKAKPKPRIRADPAARCPTVDSAADGAADGAAGGAYSSGGAADRPVERVHLVIAGELILN